jgi:TP901 family phage tail tape measure protein
MSLKIDKVQLEIIMKSDTTRAEIIKLEDQAKSLKKTMGTLKNDPAELAKASAEYDKVTNRIKDLKNSIGLAGMTMKELGVRSKELSLQLRNIDPRTPKYKEFRTELDHVNNRMKELRGNAEGSKMSLGKAADGFNKYFGMATAGIAAFTGLTFAVKKFMDARLELEDSKANLKALTGLGDTDIEWLTEQARILSTEVTKTGVRVRGSSKEIVDAFTLVGSAKPELLKDKDALKEVTEQALILATASKMEVGDAVKGLTIGLNMYGASASEAARYTNVLGAGAKEGAAEVSSQTESILKAGVAASQANIPIEQLVGSIQALAEKGIKDEIAGTGLKTFFIKLQSGADDTNPKIVGLQKALENLAAKNLSSAQIQKRFGLETYTVAAAMIASAAKVDFYTKAVTGTNVALEQAQINSQTTAAMLAQSKNKFQETGMEVVGHLNPAILKATNLSTQFLKVLLELPRIFKENKGLLLTLAITMGAYAIAVERARIASFAQMVLEKAKLVWSAATTAATLLQVAVTGYLTGATRAANLATKQLFATLMINPYVALGVLIGAVTIGLYKWITANNAAGLVLKSNANIQKQVDEQYTSQEAKIKSLVSIMGSELFSLEERRKALLELKKIVPGYHGDLTNEGKLINDNRKAIDDYLISLEKEIRLQASKDELIELYKKKRLQEKTVKEKDASAASAEAASNTTIIGESQFGSAGRGLMAAQSKSFANAARKELDDTTATIKVIESEYAKLSQLPSVNANTSKPTTVTPTKIGLTDEQRTAAQKKKLDALENEFIEAQNKRKKLHETDKATEESYNKDLLQLQIDYLEKKKNLYKVGSKDYNEIEGQLQDIRLKQTKDGNAALLKVAQDNFKANTKSTDSFEKLEKTKLIDKISTKKQYEDSLLALEVTANERRVADANAYAKEIETVTFESEDAKLAAVETANQAIVAAEEKLALSKKAIDDKKLKEEEDFQEKRKSFRDKFGLDDISSVKKQYDKELAELKKGLNDQYLTEKEFRAKKLQLGAKTGAKYAQQAVEYSGMVADAVSAYQQMETASLEAEKQKQLSAAGNNADARAKIEAEFAQKELDLKKKQSKAAMAIQIAQAVAAGALAIANIWATHAANPILAGILTAISAATSIIQIGTIVKQNAAIQATTLDSSTSGNDSGATPVTGARVVTPQAADGRYDVIGAQDSKLYRNVRYAGVARTGMVHTPTLYGEAGTELVISAPDLRRLNMKAPGFNNFVLNNRVNQRADGNYASLQNGGGSANAVTDNGALIAANMATMNRVANLLEWLTNNRIEAYTLLNEFEKKRDLRDKSLKKGSIE